MSNLIFLLVNEVNPVDYSKYISVIILSIFPILTIIIIDSIIFIFEFLTKLESHKSKFHHQISHMLKICLYSCLVYWISFSVCEITTNPLLEQSSGFIHNDISLSTYQAMSIYIFQFLLSRGIISKGYAIIKLLVIYSFNFILSLIKNKKIVPIEKKEFPIGKNSLLD